MGSKRSISDQTLLFKEKLLNALWNLTPDLGRERASSQENLRWTFSVNLEAGKLAFEALMDIISPLDSISESKGEK